MRLLNIFKKKKVTSVELLSGKAESEFLMRYDLNNDLSELCLIALIIDFFDNHDIFIQNWAYHEIYKGVAVRRGFDASVTYRNKMINLDQFETSRLKALRKAVTIANNMYNQLYMSYEKT